MVILRYFYFPFKIFSSQKVYYLNNFPHALDSLLKIFMHHLIKSTSYLVAVFKALISLQLFSLRNCQFNSLVNYSHICGRNLLTLWDNKMRQFTEIYSHNYRDTVDYRIHRRERELYVRGSWILVNSICRWKNAAIKKRLGKFPTITIVHRNVSL